MTWNRTWIFALAIVLTAGMSWAGCNGTDGGTGSTPEDPEEFEESIPSGEMLELGTSSGSGGGSADGDFATAGQGLTGQPSRIAEHAQKVADRVNTAREKTRALIDKALATEPDGFKTVGSLTCQLWKHAGANNNWELRACRLDKAAKRYAIALRGRPTASTAAADWKVVHAGIASVLERADGKKRGHGIAGYDLDNANALTGEGPTGKMAIGFRAAGKYRQHLVGVKNFQPVGADAAYSALYHHGRVAGKGGFLRFVFNADVLSVDTTDPVDPKLSEDKDGKNERGRVGMAWTFEGKARLAAIVCGGSLGADKCISINQCWAADQKITFESLDPNADNKPDFSSTDCPTKAELPVEITEAPTDAEVTPDDAKNPSAGDESVPGPKVEAPAAAADLEAG